MNRKYIYEYSIDFKKKISYLISAQDSVVRIILMNKVLCHKNFRSKLIF